MKKIAIHQPNLFPWLGYFYKIRLCDEFIFLDHTVNNKSESTYTRRVKIIGNNGTEFNVTIPLKKTNNSNFSALNTWEIKFDQHGFPEKLLKTIESTYKKHPFYDETIPLIHKFFINSDESLVNKNIEFIVSVCELLNIKRPFYRSSELQYEGKSTDLLISLVKNIAGETYISGKGGDNYQNPVLFKEHSISLEYTNFVHPVYDQRMQTNFKSGLSILDALFNLGTEGTRKLLF